MSGCYISRHRCNWKADMLRPMDCLRMTSLSLLQCQPLPSHVTVTTGCAYRSVSVISTIELVLSGYEPRAPSSSHPPPPPPTGNRICGKTKTRTALRQVFPQQGNNASRTYEGPPHMLGHAYGGCSSNRCCSFPYALLTVQWESRQGDRRCGA